MSTVDDNRRNIIIIGGGFAGATLVRDLQHKLSAPYRVVLVSEESYTTFNPMLPEAVGASIFPEHVVAPLREIVDVGHGHRFIMGRVTAVDQQAKTICCDTLAGQHHLAYDQLILAFGNCARLDFLPGMLDFALPLKNVGDAMEIRNTVLRRLAQAELETDLAKKRLLAQFIIIGGGFSGVEVAGELVDCLHSIRHYYPGVPPDSIGVTVLHDGEQLLPELPAALGQAAMKSLKERGVQVMTMQRATTILADGVLVGSDVKFSAATVICTVGTQPNGLIAELGLATDRSRLVTLPDMRIPGVPGLWALGDCAAVPNALDGKISPPTAQFAVRQAKLLASNLLNVLKEVETQAFSHQALGMMAAIGHMKGVALIGKIQLSGILGWFLWRAYYLSQMPTLGRKVRIFVEWTWGMFFPADITHLRFARSKDRTLAVPVPARPSGNEMESESCPR